MTSKRLGTRVREFDYMYVAIVHNSYIVHYGIFNMGDNHSCL